MLLGPLTCFVFILHIDLHWISLQIHTLERRPYANVLLTKGVVGPDGRDLKPMLQ